MSGTWAAARAAIAERLDGLTVTVPGLHQETLRALEHAPAGRQDVKNFPYAFVLPRGRSVTREPGGQRITTVQAAVRVILAPRAQTLDMRRLQQRYDAWCDRLAAAFDGAVALGGAVDIFESQEFEGLAFFDDVDTGWGFDLVLGELEFSETVEFSA